MVDQNQLFGNAHGLERELFDLRLKIQKSSLLSHKGQNNFS